MGRKTRLSQQRKKLERERKIASFMAQTGLERSTAIKCLKANNWKQNVAVREAHNIMKEIEKTKPAEKKNKSLPTEDKSKLIKELTMTLYIKNSVSIRYLKKNGWNLEAAISNYEADHNKALTNATKSKKASTKAEQKLKEPASQSRKETVVVHTASPKSPLTENLPSESAGKEPVSSVSAFHLGVKSFVVYQNKFRCRHDFHVIEDIDASVRIITDKGDDMTVTVPAGYCKTCGTFFIMTDTYERLKKKGTIACRVSSGKAYMTGANVVGNMVLAQESVLKQFGYSVSQTDGLSALRRRKILALVTDNKILTRAEIIGYLDFFISHHKESKHEVAVSKWEEDKKFMHGYKIGSYSNYGVSGLQF